MLCPIFICNLAYISIVYTLYCYEERELLITRSSLNELIFVQMVHLYKDPDGETVLGPSAYNEVIALDNKHSEVKEF